MDASKELNRLNFIKTFFKKRKKIFELKLDRIDHETYIDDTGSEVYRDDQTVSNTKREIAKIDKALAYLSELEAHLDELV